MKKSILLLAAGSLLLSSCNMDGFSSSPYFKSINSVKAYYSFTKEALELCGSFRHSIETVTSIKHPENRDIVTIVDKHRGTFIRAKDAQGRREAIEYVSIDWSLPESYPLKLEEPGTYMKRVNLRAEESRDWRYHLELKCKNTDKVIKSTNSGISSSHLYYIDAKNGKITVDFQTVPAEIYNIAEGSSGSDPRYYIELPHPINIP